MAIYSGLRQLPARFLEWLGKLFNDPVHREYSISWVYAPPIPDWALPDDCLIHETKSLDEVERGYNNRGFDTSVILQSHSHEEPTCARAIGFPFNFPKRIKLVRWGNHVVLRLHVGLYRNAYGYIVSIPHIEPDPAYCPLEHLSMFAKENAVNNIEAVNFLKAFLGSWEEWGLIHQ